MTQEEREELSGILIGDMRNLIDDWRSLSNAYKERRDELISERDALKNENQRMRELLRQVLQTGCEAVTGDAIEDFLAEHHTGDTKCRGLL